MKIKNNKKMKKLIVYFFSSVTSVVSNSSSSSGSLTNGIFSAYSKKSNEFLIIRGTTQFYEHTLRHQRLEYFRHNNTIISLIVFQNSTNRTCCRTHRCIQHMNIFSLNPNVGQRINQKELSTY